MDWPEVAVLLVTYDRADEIRRVIYSLLKHIQYPREKLRWHLADDSSPGHYLDDIKQEFKYLNFSATVTDRKGWSANVNKALMFLYHKTPFVYLNEDDYVAFKDVALERAVALMMSKRDSHRPEGAPPRQKIAMVRFGFGAHWLTMQQREADTKIGRFDYLHLLQGSPFLNLYSHRPSLRHKRLTDFYGFYDEGASLAESETRYANIVKHKKGGPWITCLSSDIDNMYDHIGKSRQGSAEDKNYKG